jgi:phage shock protein C
MTASTETAPRVLRRSSDGRVIAGVAAGLGRYFGTDPAVLRIAFVILALLPPGIGLLAYLVAWVAIPGDGAGKKDDEASSSGGGPAVATTAVATVIGAALVVLGALFAVETAEPSWIDFDGRYVGAAVLVLLGLGLLFRGARD